MSSLSRLYKLLSPKMGQYGNHMLPMSFSKYNTRDVVIKTRMPKYCTIFDVSHMGVFETSITMETNYYLEKLLKINVSKIKENKSKLSVILDKNYNIIDDLIISNIDNDKYRLVVNSNTINYFKKYKFLTEKKKNIIAIQGNGSQNILEYILNKSLNDMYFMENKTIEENYFELSRCGYTGEDGFELYLNDNIASKIFNELIDLSFQNDKILFGGLIARDILRLEAGLNLSGVEFNENMNINFNAINMNFLIDKKYRNNDKTSKYKQHYISSKTPIKTGSIYFNETDIGFITSSSKSYNFNNFIGLAYIINDLNDINNDNIYSLNNKNKKVELNISSQKFMFPNYYKKN